MARSIALFCSVCILTMNSGAQRWRCWWFITVGVSLSPACWHSRLLWPLWLISLATMSVLMSGGVFGLKSVPSADWGGLPLTLLLFSGTVIIGMPVSVMLALGRRSLALLARPVGDIY
ncbi:hypothetical protein CWS02_13645 [Enterobacter sp. EA-1]|nr:hypothetical protein CWS02_13645 [Enterobacter sp. EA-1]